MISTAHNLVKNVLDLLYPLRCGGCGADGSVLCQECVDMFQMVEEGLSCPVCGMPLGIRKLCGRCLDKKRLFHEGLYGFYYENRLREAIHSFKFSGRKDVGRRLVRLVESKIVAFAHQFNCIIPLPVTDKRLRQRGFNQSYILAEEISGMTGRPIFHSILLKTRETKDQYTLSKEERKKNVRGAFSLDHKVSHVITGKSVLLVDDLYTTGQTAREATRVLLQVKPERVVLFALARTP